MSAWESYLSSLGDKAVKKLDELARQEEFVIDGKTYKRKKVTTAQHNELEDMRADFASLQSKDPRQAAAQLAAIYEKAALYYLGMGKDAFENSAWEDLKRAVDASAYRVAFANFF